MVEWGIPEKILKNAVQTHWSFVDRTPQSKVMSKYHFAWFTHCDYNWGWGGVHFKGKETYLGKMRFLTSVSIRPGTKNQFCVIWISQKGVIVKQKSFCVENIGNISVKVVLKSWTCVSINLEKLSNSQVRILETVDRDSIWKQNHESWETLKGNKLFWTSLELCLNSF